MKSKTLTHPRLNKGRITTIHYPLSDTEFDNQFNEIFDQEHYKLGRIKDSVYVDIGANIGLTAHYFAPFATKYYAIEPSKECFEALEKNTQDLPIERFNIAILPSDRQYNLFQTAKDSVGQTFFANEGSTFGHESVHGIPIDQFFRENNIEHVDVMKVDIENAEYVLFPDDSFARVADKIDTIIGEAHYDTITGAIPAILPVILDKYGFTTTFTKDKNFIYKLFYTQTNGRQDIHDLQCNTIFVSRRNK